MQARLLWERLFRRSTDGRRESQFISLGAKASPFLKSEDRVKSIGINTV